MSLSTLVIRVVTARRSHTTGNFHRIEAEKGLSVLGSVAPVHTVMRNDYQDSLGVGLGVTEYQPEGKAADEIRSLWQWIQKKMEKNTYAQETNFA